jgi:plastocyanin
MKTLLLIPFTLAATMCLATAEEKKSDKTLGEKTSETLEKAKEKTKDAGRAVAETTKDAGRAVAETSKKAADAVVDAVTPDKDANKVDVKLTEHQIDMPKQLSSGKTAFVVQNTGKEKHNFEIAGEGIKKKFFADVSPDETKVLHVDLKPGSYKVFCPMKEGEGMKLSLTVK